MQKQFIIIAFLSLLCASAQEKNNNDIPFTDNKYREDQFYIGFTYNFINKKPNHISQQGFSGGYQLGFIRDMPLNKKRTIALGLGLGYATNSYNQNILIQQNNTGISYSVLDRNTTSFSKNKLNTHKLELPIQFRWRTSTPTSHKFWRIYTGIKLGYTFNSIVKHKGEAGDYKIRNLNDIQRFQTDFDISFGWNTWNFYVSYGMQPLLKNTAKLEGKTIEMSSIKFGLIFYIF